MKELQLAYSRHEKVTRMIANLEEMKEQGQIEEPDYQVLLGQYKALLENTAANVHDIRERLKEQQANAIEEQKTAEAELKNIKLRAKVGEIAPQDVPKIMARAQKQYDQASARLIHITEALAAKNAAAHGGFIADINVQKRIDYNPGRKSISLPGATSFTSGVQKFSLKGEGVWPVWDAVRGKIGMHVTSDGALAAIRYVAAGLLCIVTLTLLIKSVGLFKAAQFASGTQQAVSAGLGFLNQLGGQDARSLSGVAPKLGAGGLYFWALLAFARGTGFGVGAFAYFAKKTWGQPLVFCLSVLSLLLIVIGVVQGGLGFTTVLGVAVYGFALYSSIVSAR